MMRKGMGRGQGSGWKNIAGNDSHRHSLASKGIKSAQKIKFPIYGIGNIVRGEEIYNIVPKSKIPQDISYQGLREFHGSAMSIYYSKSKNEYYGYRNGKYLSFVDSVKIPFSKKRSVPVEEQDKMYDINRANRNASIFGDVRNTLITKRANKNPNKSVTDVMNELDSEMSKFEPETKSHVFDAFEGEVVKNAVGLLRKDTRFQALLKEAGLK